MNETEELFWAKVDKSGDCWEWKNGCCRGEYGIFWFEGRAEGAHRVSWKLEYGSIPDGFCVLHHCDNPICVRPSHLWLGTHADNLGDMAEKDRSTHGEAHPQCKLREAQVLAIRQIGGSITQRLLARLFGISPTQVRNIIHRKQWVRI